MVTVSFNPGARQDCPNLSDIKVDCLSTMAQPTSMIPSPPAPQSPFPIFCKLLYQDSKLFISNACEPGDFLRNTPTQPSIQISDSVLCKAQFHWRGHTEFFDCTYRSSSNKLRGFKNASGSELVVMQMGGTLLGFEPRLMFGEKPLRIGRFCRKRVPSSVPPGEEEWIMVKFLKEERSSLHNLWNGCNKVQMNMVPDRTKNF